MIFMFCWHVYFIWFTLSRFHIYIQFFVIINNKKLYWYRTLFISCCTELFVKNCVYVLYQNISPQSTKKNYSKFCKKRTFYARFYDFVYRTNNKFTYMVHKNNAFLREWLLKKNHDLLFLWALNNIKNIYIKIKLKEKHEKPIRVLKLNTTKKIRKF